MQALLGQTTSNLKSITTGNLLGRWPSHISQESAVVVHRKASFAFVITSAFQGWLRIVWEGKRGWLSSINYSLYLDESEDLENLKQFRLWRTKYIVQYVSFNKITKLTEALFYKLMNLPCSFMKIKINRIFVKISSTFLTWGIINHWDRSQRYVLNSSVLGISNQNWMSI